MIVNVVRVEIVQESLIIYPSDCGCRRAWLSLSNDAIHFFPRSGHPAHKLFPVGCANEVANVARSLIVKWHCGVLDRIDCPGVQLRLARMSDRFCQYYLERFQLSASELAD